MINYLLVNLYLRVAKKCHGRSATEGPVVNFCKIKWNDGRRWRRSFNQTIVVNNFMFIISDIRYARIQHPSSD